MALDNYKISNSDKTNNWVQSADDTLSGTPTANKSVFDKFPLKIMERFNAFVEYVGTTSTVEGDAGLNYNSTEVALICAALDCTEQDITK